MEHRIVTSYKPPSESEVSKLTKSELAVYQWLVRSCPEPWEIYVQPCLNNLRPDFIIYHPSYGVIVIEVKSSVLVCYVEAVGGPGTRGETYRFDGEGECAMRDPLEQMRHYEDRLYNIYCPRVPQGEMSRKFTCIVAMPFSAEADAARYAVHLRERTKDNGKPIIFIGRETINGNELSNRLSMFTRYEAFVDHEINWIDDLRGWIAEPDYRKNPAAIHKLDKKQERLATTRTEKGFRRVIGPAGSGKSIVLAHRAANLAREGKSVLVCTYNVTMMNYLRYLVGGCRLDKEQRWRIQFNWFHHWIGDFCLENGVKYPFTRRWEIEREFRFADQRKDDPQWFWKYGCVAEALRDVQGTVVNQFDAIIVDEGQDFVLEWWIILRRALVSGGEMLIAADDAQDVYGAARSWTDVKMEGAGFNGKWSRLECNYRLPGKMIDASDRLIEQFSIQRESKALADKGLRNERSMFDWVQCDPDQVIEYLHKAINKLMTWAPCSGYSNTDIVCIVSSKATGIKLRKHLKSKGLDVYDTFFDKLTEKGDPTREERRKKLGFFHTRQMVKITTTESFKGWEARALVFETGVVSDDRTKYGMYVGLTRLSRSEGGSIVVVVSQDESMSEYGSGAQNFYDERRSAKLGAV